MVQNRPPPAGALDAVEERLRLGLIVDLDGGFAEVVRTHERVVASVALRLSATPADAEDAAAETFLRAYRALLGYDAATRDAGRRPPPPPEAEPVERAAAGPSVEQQVEQDLEHREWARLLGRLPEAQRTAVVLRHVEGVPTGEIAEILGCPEGTAKSHVSRGLRRLRALLTECEGDDR